MLAVLIAVPELTGVCNRPVCWSTATVPPVDTSHIMIRRKPHAEPNVIVRVVPPPVQFGLQNVTKPFWSAAL